MTGYVPAVALVLAGILTVFGAALARRRAGLLCAVGLMMVGFGCTILRGTPPV